MNIYVVLIIISILITIIFAIIYTIMKRKNCFEAIKFKDVYNNKNYNKVEEDSLCAGKVNSPFLDKDIFYTIKKGNEIVNSTGNLFEGVVSYDTKPNWE